MVRALGASRIAAIWTAVALLAIPVWAGNSMFNVKDIPVASGYTFLTFGLVSALCYGPRPSRGRSIGVGLLVFFGTAVAVGTRPAIWLPFVVTIAAFVLCAWLLSNRLRSGLLAVPLTAFALGIVAVAAVNYDLASTPLEWLYKSVDASSSFGNGEPTLTAGVTVLADDAPFWYLPAWVFANTPVLIFGLAVAGGVIVLRSAWTSRRASATVTPTERARGLAGGLVVLQLLLLPCASILASSTMYNGLRQHLYIVPALAMLAGVAAARAIDTLQVRSSRGWRAGIAVLLTAALLIPAVEQTRLYPYNYIYVNPVAGIGGVFDNWATEVQMLSLREAESAIPRNAPQQCGLFFGQGATLSEAGAAGPCDPLWSPFMDEIGTDASGPVSPGATWVVSRAGSTGSIPDWCTKVGTVSRPLRGEEIPLAYVMRCVDPKG